MATRKEKQAEAARRRADLKLGWIDEMRRLLMEEKLTYSEAAEKLGLEVEGMLDREPTRKADILQAWAEMFNELKARCKEIQQTS